MKSYMVVISCSWRICTVNKRNEEKRTVRIIISVEFLLRKRQNEEIYSSCINLVERKNIESAITAASIHPFACTA